MGLDANEVCGGSREEGERAGVCVGGGHARSASSCCCPQKFLEPPQYSDLPGETPPPPRGQQTQRGWGRDGLLPRLGACIAVQMGSFKIKKNNNRGVGGVVGRLQRRRNQDWFLFILRS